jgi:peroxiredoxin
LRSTLARSFGFLVLVSVAAFAQTGVVLRGLDGQTVNPADARGRVVVLAFGATWTPLAAKELPAFQQLADRYPNRGVTFYWVSINTAKDGARNFASDADLRAFASRSGLKMPVLRDPEQAAYRAYGVTGLPAVVVLDKSGQVAHRLTGFDPDRPEGFTGIEAVLEKLTK